MSPARDDADDADRTERQTDPDADLATVGALLTAAGVRPPAEEVDRLARLYPSIRASLERFHRVDVGDEVPAAVFRAGEVHEP